MDKKTSLGIVSNNSFIVLMYIETTLKFAAVLSAPSSVQASCGEPHATQKDSYDTSIWESIPTT